MSTSMNMQSEIYDARKALSSYLERTDLLLARSGLSRSERDETLGQIVEQFYDLLGAPIGEANREQTVNAISQLAPVLGYELKEYMTKGQRLRAAWHWFWVGGFTPMFLNDQGCKRVVWSELIKQWLYITLFMAIALTIGNINHSARPSWKWYPQGFIICMITTILLFGYYSRYRFTTVEKMPRAEDWSESYLRKTLFSRTLMSVATFLLPLALYSLSLWLIMPLAKIVRPWSAQNGVLGVLIIAIMLSVAYRYRRGHNRRRIENWIQQGDPS